MDNKERRTKITKLDDLDLLNWIIDQEYHWREAVSSLSNADTLQELVDYVRNNYHRIKKLEKEKRHGTIL